MFTCFSQYCILLCYLVADDRPSVKDLHNHVVGRVASKWRDLGIQLLNPTNESIFDIIEEDHPKNIIACCKSMLQKWLDMKTDATWNQILNALRSSCVQLYYLADEIESKLKEKTCEANMHNCILRMWDVHFGVLMNIHPLHLATPFTSIALVVLFYVTKPCQCIN